MQIQLSDNQRFLNCSLTKKNGLKNHDINFVNKHNQYISQSISFKGLDALIFDADGTMVLSAPYHDPAWTQLCLNHQPNNLPINYKAGLTKTNVEIFKNFPHNGTTEETIKQLFGDINPATIKEYAAEKEVLFLKSAKDIQEVNGLTKFIESLSNIKKGIATCAHPSSISFYLQKLDFNKYFELKNIIDASKITKGKPDPEVYLKAAESLNVLPQNCMVFEDSEEGIKSAIRAGMKVIGVSTSLSKEKLTGLGTSLAIKDYSEINLSKIRSLFEKGLSKLK